MVTVRIKDHVAQASSYEDGQIIFDLISPSLRSGEVVNISFEGIQAVPSSFINAAFVQLLEISTFEQIKESLRIIQSTKFINDLIRRRFEFADENKAP